MGPKSQKMKYLKEMKGKGKNIYEKTKEKSNSCVMRTNPEWLNVNRVDKLVMMCTCGILIIMITFHHVGVKRLMKKIIIYIYKNQIASLEKWHHFDSCMHSNDSS